MDNYGEMLIYQTEDGLTKIDVNMYDETVWLSLDQMADLFARDKSTISRHIKNIFEEGELVKKSVVANFATTAADGKIYQVDYYNLDVIISVGYRVKSQRGVQFRIWATSILKEYIKKGFAMDDECLKELGGGGYFKELLERIRDIRASEKVFYRQGLEIYATSVDYDPKAEVSIQFFKKVQNKIHYAISGETAAEVIYHRADAEKDFMGLESYMDRLGKEYIELLSEDANPSEKFWRLEKRIKEDRKKAGVRVEMSRSNLIYNIISLINEDAISLEDLEEFSDELKETLRAFIGR